MSAQTDDKEGIPKVPQTEYWIAAEKLGVLESRITGMIAEFSKHKRRTQFNALVKVLKGLGLIAPNDFVVTITYGCNNLGEKGLQICVVPTVKIDGYLPARGA